MTTNNKISKSEVMKRAWAKFREKTLRKKIGAWNFNNFSDCLRWAWLQVKSAVKTVIENVAKRAEMAIRDAERANRPLQAWELAAQRHYDNAPSGTYFGD